MARLKLKIALSILICLLTVTGLSQSLQKSDNPPGVTVGKLKWQRVGAAPTIDSSFKAESDSPSGGSLSDPNGPSPDSPANIQRGPSFTYSVEIKNDGQKSIKAILWEYLITDKKTGEELGRHQFVNFEKIGKLSVKTLTARSRVSPTQVISVQGSTDNSNTVERVVFRCVLYDDGTLWREPGTADATCEALKKRAMK